MPVRAEGAAPGVEAAVATMLLPVAGDANASLAVRKAAEAAGVAPSFPAVAAPCEVVAPLEPSDTQATA